MDELHRPYPRAVTGEIKAYRHDRKENTFTLTYEQTKAFDTKTIIYLPANPAEVICTGEYELVPCTYGGYTLEIKTDIGSHEVKVNF